MVPLAAFFFLVFFLTGADDSSSGAGSAVVGDVLGVVKHLGKSLSTSTLGAGSLFEGGGAANVADDILAAVDILCQ